MDLFEKLDVSGLHLHELDREFESDVFKSYKTTTGNIIMPSILNKYYAMNDAGNVVFIGNDKMLHSFLNTYTKGVNNDS